MLAQSINTSSVALVPLDEESLKMLDGSFDTEDEFSRLADTPSRLFESLEACRKELWRASQLTKEILVSMNEGIIVCDRQFRCRAWNRFMENLTGLRAEDVLGKCLLLLDLPPLFGKQGIHSMMARALDGGFWNEECGLHNHNSGKWTWCSCAYGPHRSATGDIIGTIVLAQDITEQKRQEETLRQLEKQLRQSQKMEAMGTLAAGIAHDFNNVLTPITGYAELVASDVKDGIEPNLRHLDEILKAAHRAKNLVRQILTFSRQSEQEQQPLRICSIIKEAVKLLRASLPSTIEIEQSITGMGKILGDPTQIHQLLMNLCTNAAHAMREKGGTLTISLSDVHVSSMDIARDPGLKPGSHVRLVIADTGHGMDHSNIDKIFDPFFTTKEPGEGTGLGLSVAHGIVGNHGGVIRVRSEPGNGATFEVLLPRTDRADKKESTEIKPIPTGNARILYVDDEPSIARLGQTMLERIGYRVVSKTSSMEALDAFRSRAPEDAFDLVISDLTMPGMTGIDLARELQRIQPHIPIILCTGYSETITPDKADLKGIQGFITKPLEHRQLAETIRNAIMMHGER